MKYTTLYKVYFRHNYKMDSTYIITVNIEDIQKKLEKLFPKAYFIDAVKVRDILLEKEDKSKKKVMK